MKTKMYVYIRVCTYSYGHGISSVILLSIRKNVCTLSFIFTMTDIQHFCDRNSVTHKKYQHATSTVFDWQINIHVKNSNVGLEIYKTCFTANVSWMTTTDEIPLPWLYKYKK
jgi:hypothetical protein